MKFLKKAKEIAGKIAGKISGIFDKGKLDDLAKETGFVQRSTGKIKGEDFVRLLTVETLGEEAVSTEGMCDILRQTNPEADMSPQGLSERINKDEAAEYLKEVYERTLAENLSPVKSDISPELLSPFGRVFLEDSTQITLSEKLAEEFPGSGGSASKSAVKIDLLYEVKQDIIQKIIIGDGKTPDQFRSDDILSGIRKNDLFIRDLGYFAVPSLSGISAEGAFFLSRLLKGVSVYLSDDADAKAVSLPKYVNIHFGELSAGEIRVYIGEKEKLPCRLVFYRLPEEVVRERRSNARKKARKKGRQPTKEYLDWLEFAFFVTNVPQETWEAEVVGTVYRFRWQIELTFRHWKSLMNIRVFKGTLPERIKCLIYGRLITVVVVTMICGYASWYAFGYLKKEASFHKIICWLKRKDRLAEAIRSGRLNDLFGELVKIISKSLCKQKRKRKTTRQLLDEKIPYTESFPQTGSGNEENNADAPVLKEQTV